MDYTGFSNYLREKYRTINGSRLEIERVFVTPKTEKHLGVRIYFTEAGEEWWYIGDYTSGRGWYVNRDYIKGFYISGNKQINAWNYK